jgi:hypothetical protein
VEGLPPVHETHGEILAPLGEDIWYFVLKEDLLELLESSRMFYCEPVAGLHCFATADVVVHH